MVIRRVAENNIGASRPCHYCLKLMKRVGINRVYYSTDDNTIVYEKVSEMVSNHFSLGARAKHKLDRS